MIGGLIVPHAGYEYSASISAAAYRFLSPIGSSATRVIVLAASHFSDFKGRVGLSQFDAWQTPLGSVPADNATMSTWLVAQPDLFAAVPANADLREHSVEMQLPWLQRRLPSGFMLLPLLIGHISLMTQSRVVQQLLALIGTSPLRSVIIVSTDFAHYGPDYGWNPVPMKPSQTVAQLVRSLDGRCIRAVESGNDNAFRAALKSTGDTICGANAVSMLLELLTQLNRSPPRFVAYRQSNPPSDTTQNSVSYASAVF